MNILFTLIIGICIGMANIIPGVSGGTIAVVFNVYDKLLNSITFNLKKLAKNWKFVVPIFLGMGIGVLIFSKGIQFLYDKFPTQTNYAFTGLIIGSIPMLFSYLKDDKSDEKRDVNWKNICGIVICVLAGLALILLFNYFENKYGAGDTLNFVLPKWSVPLAVKIFIAGIVGAVAMIVPGISGSLLMLIMGVYPIVITSIPALLVKETFLQALFLLLPNGVGVLVGLLAGAKLISLCLKKSPSFTYAVILGLIIGSAYTLFPGFSEIKSVGCAIGCIVCVVLGFLAAYFSAKFTSKENKE